MNDLQNLTDGVTDDSVLGRLRTATDVWHRATEDLLDLMSPGLTTEHYGDVLRGMAAVYEPLEAAITAVDDTGDGNFLGFGWQGHRRTDLLMLDLSDLDSTPGTFDETVPVDDMASAFGAAYVLEGASMGAMAIVPHLEATIGDQPRRFFEAGARDARARWLDFRRAARRAITSDDAIAGAEETAVWTFSAIHRACTASLGAST